ncbi:LysR substrate-binding domain-containing protein [Vibrio sp. VB16]|uniref:LysR substrate-binding domain-containing protein n=1 Tax=Vibrio sp. VB16 TaxID=2785746 RepID=UPI00189C619E|nr:LysR substrate-binding domain-containing protein [Vibrio sp. VB16]UGA55616.1 LysR substrate-binding domain-containing protein [Vibrio sp. VB16]
MTNPITLDALRILDAIDRKESFAAAAEELYRVPSAVSYTVKKLEEDLSVVIFDRSKRKAEFTVTGQLLLKHGRSILQATDNLSKLVIQAESGWEPELRICVDNIINCQPIYALIGEFQKHYPHVEIKLVEEVFGGTFDALDSGRVDLAIGTPLDIDTIKYQCLGIGEIDFVFAVASDHPLTALRQPITIEEVKQYPSIVVSDSSKSLPAKSSGIFEGQRRLTVPTVDKKITLHLLGLGVGYLPLFRIKKELDSGELVVLDTSPLTNRSNNLGIGWRKDNTGKALNWFIEKLSDLKREEFVS